MPEHLKVTSRAEAIGGAEEAAVSDELVAVLGHLCWLDEYGKELEAWGARVDLHNAGLLGEPLGPESPVMGIYWTDDDERLAFKDEPLNRIIAAQESIASLTATDLRRLADDKRSLDRLTPVELEESRLGWSISAQRSARDCFTQ